MTTLVWFKRDLRVSDHAPLHTAAMADRALGLYVIEPEWLASPECDARHLAFVLDCLRELRQDLAERGLPLVVRVGPVLPLLARLHQHLGLTQIVSHEETGPGWSYARDRAVGAWCVAHGVPWQEFTQTGVVRRLRSRNAWARTWQARMDAPMLLPPASFAGVPEVPVQQRELPTLQDLGMAPPNCTVQAGGEAAALATLQDFLIFRGRDYRRALSSPLTAEEGCSRLSPHLAFGTVSMRTVHQATERAIALAAASADPADRQRAYSLRGFAGRLRWHCHFMQKLEDEPGIEYRNFARAYDGLRPGDEPTPWTDEAQRRFEAWCAGRTGYPMVDACMRSLVATGWLNFRMRAMLVSFASYHLWLHWRPTGLFLARQFLDFEAGIHWSQMQMQSGTTGINTLRIYSPTRQAQDHDPEGLFIRRWVPELRQVPLPLLAQPWRMNDGRHPDYPAPIVDDRTAVQWAKDQLYPLRKMPQAREEADAIQQRHGSRKSGLQPSITRAKVGRATPKPTHPGQADLFGFGADT